LPDIRPTVSIIIPTYNRKSFLKNAIDSVLAQSYEDFELIIIDNYSTDGTEEMVQKYSDPRLRFVKLERTGSVAASRNLGVRLSRATWIAFLDSDDWWRIEKLKVVSDWFLPSIDLIYHPLEKVFQDASVTKAPKSKIVKLKKPLYMHLLLYGNEIGLSSVVIRKTILEEAGYMREEPRFWSIDDYDTWLRVSKITENFKLVPQALGFYRIHDSNISSDNSYEYVCKALAEHLLLLNSSQLKRFDSLYYYKTARSLYNEKNYKDSLPYLKFVLKHGRFEAVLKALYMISTFYLIHSWFSKFAR